MQTKSALRLRAYLAERDAPCPQCGYNLRGLEDVSCPECGFGLDDQFLRQRDSLLTPAEALLGRPGFGLLLVLNVLMVLLVETAGPGTVHPSFVEHLLRWPRFGKADLGILQVGPLLLLASWWHVDSRSDAEVLTGRSADRVMAASWGATMVHALVALWCVT